MIRLATANLRNSLRHHSQRQDVLFPLPSWISWFACVCTWTHDFMWGINYKVFPMGLGPMTPALKGRCSNQLSYENKWGLHDTNQQRPLVYHLLLATPVVDSMGLKPMNIMLCQSRYVTSQFSAFYYAIHFIGTGVGHLFSESGDMNWLFTILGFLQVSVKYA